MCKPFVGLTVMPDTDLVISATETLQLYCAMNLDITFITKSLTWKLNGGSDVSECHFIIPGFMFIDAS